MDVREEILTDEILWISLDSAAAAFEHLKTSSVNVVVIEDASLGAAHDCTVEDLLAELQQINRDIPIVIRDEAASVADPARYLPLGAPHSTTPRPPSPHTLLPAPH